SGAVYAGGGGVWADYGRELLGQGRKSKVEGRRSAMEQTEGRREGETERGLRIFFGTDFLSLSLCRSDGNLVESPKSKVEGRRSGVDVEPMEGQRERETERSPRRFSGTDFDSLSPSFSPSFIHH